MATHNLSPEKRKVMYDITGCRTSAFGGRTMECNQCDDIIILYNSCRNRHCPLCQNMAQGKWVIQQCDKLLNTHYFHVVMTMPDRLRLLASLNPRQVYAILLRAAGRTLIKRLQEPRYLGATPAVTVVLHTWTRELLYHPHVHCIVSGGGLSPDGQQWISSRRRFLLDLKLMSATFRDMVIGMLTDAFKQDKLRFNDKGPRDGRANRFIKLMKTLKRKKWNSHAKTTFSKPVQVIKYLGRYTHRTGISNQRIISVDDNGVCFHTKNGRTITIPPHEFIRRFLLHLLPSGFVKVRHYGLYASSNVAAKLSIAQRLLDEHSGDSNSEKQCTFTDQPEKPQWALLYEALTGIKALRCRSCQGGWLVLKLPIEPSTPEIIDTS